MITPHHSYYFCGTTFRWIGSSGNAVINMWLLALAWWCQHDVISIAKCQRIAKCHWIAVGESQEITGLLRVDGLLIIVEVQRVNGSLSVAGLLSLTNLWRITGSLSVTGQAISWLLAICWLLIILLLLADSEGVALIGCGGVNVHCLTVSLDVILFFQCYPTQFFICYWSWYCPYGLS